MSLSPTHIMTFSLSINAPVVSLLPEFKLEDFMDQTANYKANKGA